MNGVPLAGVLTGAPLAGVLTGAPLTGQAAALCSLLERLGLITVETRRNG